MATKNEESKAYLNAIKIKEIFHKEISDQDFLLENLASARDRTQKRKEKLVALSEQIMDGELVGEINTLLREVESYHMVLNGILELEEKDPKKWEVVQYLLTAKRADVGKTPAYEDRKAALTLLTRLSGFSPLASVRLTQCLEKLEGQAQPVEEKKKKKTSAWSRFMKNLGG